MTPDIWQALVLICGVILVAPGVMLLWAALRGGPND